MKESFKEIKFRADSLAMINTCNTIIDQYLAQGLRLTLRQLYYQLVTKNIIRNEERAYKRLGSIVSDGRLAGLIDWDAIEDRGRRPRTPNEFESLATLAEAAIRSYRLPRWKGQKHHVELWVEKDALSGVLAPIAQEYHVTLSVNRGYSSQSAMYESFNRMQQGSGDNEDVVLLYLGDHDPSGEDMVRDIEDRLVMFGVGGLEVRKVALTWEQIRQYNPPPNPTKLSDPRATGYIQKYGSECWEVDALPPDVLANLVRQNIESVLDSDMMDEIKEKEEIDKVALREAVKEIMKGDS